MLPDFRVRQRDYLLEIVRALTQELNLDKLLTRILRISIEMLAGQAGIIALKEAGVWRVVAAHGIPVEIAIAEPLFIARNLPAQDRTAIDQFRRELRSAIGLRAVNSRDDARDAVAAAARLAQQRLEIAPAVVVLEYLCGATNALDPYSAYLTPDQLNEVYAQIEGNFVGLGVELKAQDGGLVIVRVISGSPAEEAGVRRRRSNPGRRRPIDRGAVDRSGRQPAARRRRQRRRADAGRPGPTAAAVERPPPRGRGAQRRSGEHHRSAVRHRLLQADVLPEDDRPRPRRRAVETPPRRDEEPGDRRARQSGRAAGLGRRGGRSVRRSRDHRFDPRPESPRKTSPTRPTSRASGGCRWW